jgi:hypothetical protein
MIVSAVTSGTMMAHQMRNALDIGACACSLRFLAGFDASSSFRPGRGLPGGVWLRCAAACLFGPYALD